MRTFLRFKESSQKIWLWNSADSKRLVVPTAIEPLRLRIGNKSPRHVILRFEPFEVGQGEIAKASLRLELIGPGLTKLGHHGNNGSVFHCVSQRASFSQRAEAMKILAGRF